MTKTAAKFDKQVRIAGRTARCRAKATLANGTAMTGLAFGLMLLAPGSAYAADDCGLNLTGSVTCDATGNPYAAGITYTSAADITVSTSADVAATGPVSIVSTGTAQFNNAGTVTTAGNSVITVGVNGANGATIVSTGALTNTGNGGIVVGAIATTGNVNITSGAVSHTGLTGYGVGAAAFGGTATVTTTGLTSTLGDDGIGIIVLGQNAIVNAAAITTAGDDSAGIGVDVQDAATITVNGAITTAGDDSSGLALSGNTVTVSGPGSISTSGIDSAGMEVNAGTATIQVANITTTGAGSVGVDVEADTVAVTVNGTIATSGSGIDAVAYAGSNTITNSGSIKTTGNNAQGILAYASDAVTITNTGSVTTAGVSSDGIYADGDAVTITNAGSVTTTGDFADGIVADGGAVTISNTGSVTTTGAYADGIVADGDTVTITGNGVIKVTGTGIAAEANNDVSITTGAVTTTGAYADGISAYSYDGNVSVSSGAVATAGVYSDGIRAYSYNADVSVTTSGVTSTLGNYSDGISAEGVNVTVTSAGVTTVGDDSAGILVGADQAATVTVTGPVATQGIGSIGVGVYGETVTGTVTGAVTTSGNYAAGVVALGQDVNLQVASVSTSGDGAIGVGVLGSNVAVRATGPITTTGDGATGIFAFSGEGARVTAGAVTTSGIGATAINAFSDTGPVTVTAASVRATGAGSYGILAVGTQAVNVTTGTAFATDLPAIAATSLDDAASVTLNGAATTGTGPAVLVTGGTTANLALGTGGSLRSATGGAVLTSVTGSTVNNAGTITGTAAGPIVTALGGPLQFTNRGTFTGTIGFTDGNDVLVNTGTYRALYGQSFGAGVDRFTNSGTLLVLPGTTTAGTVAFTGLETFNNSGLIDLRNGHAGDILSTSGTFTGSGNSTLALDVNFNGANTITDRLIVGGALTGTTQLQLNANGTNPILTPGIVFATGGAGTSATAFAGNPVDVGLVQYDVAYNAANNTFALVGTPGNTVFRALRLNEAVQQLWHRSADAVAAQLGELRDAKFGGYGEDGGRFWMQGYGQTSKRESNQSFTSFGQTRSVNLDYNQDTFGGQIGLGFGTGEGALAFGVTGGYQNSEVNFSGSADRANIDAVNVGAYASFQSGTLFANVLGKYDHYWVDVTSPLSGVSDKLTGRSYGAQGELGIRFGSESFYAEPLATIAYVRTELNNLRSQGATIDFDQMDGLRGKAGLRVGSKMALGNGATVVIYAQGNYVHEFEGKDGVSFNTGGASLAFRNQAIGDYGQGKIGVSIGTAGGVSGFIEGFGNIGDNYKGGGGRGGLRIKF